MAEIRRGFGGDGGERLPWLEPVEDEDEVEEVGGFGGLVIVGLIALVAIVLVVAGIVWYRHSRAQVADVGTLIAAPTTPYKVKPSDPGGMEITSAGAVAEKTGVGGDINSPIDLTGLPEQPIVGPGSPQGAPSAQPAGAPPQTAQAQIPQRPPVSPAAAITPAAPPAPALARPQPAPAPTKIAPPPAKIASAPVQLRPAPVVPKPAPVAPPVQQVAAPAPAANLKAGTIQLGAFSTEAKANSVWKTLSGRFGALGGLGMSVNAVQSGGSTLYRLRASGPGAGKICAQLKVAGESCSVVG